MYQLRGGLFQPVISTSQVVGIWTVQESSRLLISIENIRVPDSIVQITSASLLRAKEWKRPWGSGSHMYRPNARQTPSITAGRDVTFHLDSIQNHLPSARPSIILAHLRYRPPFVTAVYFTATSLSRGGSYTVALAARRAVSLL
jgi:hypothetical protein